MANQQSLNSLLQWSIENSSSSTAATQDASNTPRDASRGLDTAALHALLGGPSDADLMKSSMAAILAPIDQVPLSEKLIAWDNFEQLVEQIDNAMNIEPLKLWEPLLSQLVNTPDAGVACHFSESRAFAAWCVSTAVQNNIKSQDALLAHGGIPVLVRVATSDPSPAVRKKAISALSSSMRNFQPGLEAVVHSILEEESISKNAGGAVLREKVKQTGTDAGDMDSLDEFIAALREFSAGL